MKIKIKKEDILEYITGETQYDAIEKIIDPTRYEVFDCGIYDNHAKKMLQQGAAYEHYCFLVRETVQAVREQTPPITENLKKKLVEVCSAIELMAPTEINLE